jgi:hypothetical protein
MSFMKRHANIPEAPVKPLVLDKMFEVANNRVNGCRRGLTRPQ